MEIEYEPRLLDEVVLRAVGARPEGRLFFRERERAYRIRDPEERAAAFDRLNVDWCTRLALDAPLHAALAEQPLVLAGVARAAVGRPPRPSDAGAELLVRAPRPREPPADGRLLRLLLAPELLLARDALTVFLRRELVHVADMLDPRFGYEPRLPAVTGGPTYERLLRERYRVAWNATVDGRLVRAGRLPTSARGERRQEFLRTFAALGPETDETFERFFDAAQPTHAAIVAFVLSPRAAEAPGRGRPAPCPLCGCLTTEHAPVSDRLPAEVVAAIHGDFPAWTPDAGCCRQCTDLYRARPLALRDLAALPGIR